MSIELYRIKYLIYAFSIDIKNFNEARAFTQQKNACSLCVCVCGGDAVNCSSAKYVKGYGKETWIR